MDERTVKTMKKIENKELSDEELDAITGGNWLTDAWDATLDWCVENKDVLTRVGCAAAGIALCASGIGIGAGLGIFAVESVGAAAIVSTGFGTLIGAGVGAAITNNKEDNKNNK